MSKAPKSIVISKSSGERERIEVCVKEFKGKTYLDIRNYYRDSETGDYKPGPKGIMVPLDLTRKLMKAQRTVLEPYQDVIDVVATPVKRRRKSDDDEVDTEIKPKKKKRKVEEEDEPVVKKKKKAKPVEEDDDEEEEIRPRKRGEIDEEDRPTPVKKRERDHDFPTKVTVTKKKKKKRTL